MLKNDPRPLKLKYSCRCASCGSRLPEGTNAFYWPLEKKVYCMACGEAGYREFLASVADEVRYMNQY